MQAKYHFIISLFLAVFYYTKFGFVGFSSCMIAGFLIDADHALVYYLNNGILTANAYLLSHGLGQPYHLLIFHSIELSILLFALSHYQKWLIVPATSLSLHIALDAAFNNL